jgi:predicted HicB family RNase H-like nuclease
MSTLKTGRPTRKEKIIASVQKIDEATIRMNVNIPKELHKKIKQKALDEDTTITELVIKAMNEYLSK